METCNLSLDVAVGRGLDAAVETALEIGPASRALQGHPSDIRAAAANSIREVLAQFAKGKTVPLGGVDLDRDRGRIVKRRGSQARSSQIIAR